MPPGLRKIVLSLASMPGASTPASRWLWLTCRGEGKAAGQLHGMAFFLRLLPEAQSQPAHSHRSGQPCIARLLA